MWFASSPSDYLDPHSRGGFIASKVDQQDAVALWLAMELFHSPERLGFDRETDLYLDCEQNEDLCFSGAQRRVVVSVKNTNMTIGEFAAELERLSTLVAMKEADLALLAFIGAVDRKIVEAIKRDEEYRSLVQEKSFVESVHIKKEFDEKYEGVFSSDVLLRQFPELDADAFTAGISQLLRRALPISDYSDERIESQIIFLSARIARARRKRGTVRLSELAEDVLSLVSNPMTRGILKGLPYKLDSAGYVLDRARANEIFFLHRKTQQAQRSTLRKFRKRHFWHALGWLMFGAPVCQNCSHPLLANLCGLGKLGIACPDCGATPFVTLYLACPCGEALLLLDQPPLDDFSAFNLALIASVSDLKCGKCGRSASYEDLDLRVFQLNIPADDTVTVTEALKNLVEPTD